MSGTFHKPEEGEQYSLLSHGLSFEFNPSTIDELGDWCLTNKLKGGATRQTEPNA